MADTTANTLESGVNVREDTTFYLVSGEGWIKSEIEPEAFLLRVTAHRTLEPDGMYYHEQPTVFLNSDGVDGFSFIENLLNTLTRYGTDATPNSFEFHTYLSWAFDRVRGYSGRGPSYMASPGNRR